MSDAGCVAAAAAALAAGEVIGVPTDTVYGVAADPWSHEAVTRLFALKGRPGIKPIPILAGDADQAGRIGRLDDRARRAAALHWPGALTLVVRRVPGLPDWVGDAERDTVGLRVPDHPAILAVLRTAGPLAVTSANRSGGAPAGDHREAAAVFGDEIAVYVPGAGLGGEPSTVVDLTGPTSRVLRPGPVAWEG